MLILGYDQDSYRDSIREILNHSALKELDRDGTLFTEENIANLSAMIARALPAAFAIIWLTITLFNLWMAGLIVDASGRALQALAQSARPRASRTLCCSCSPQRLLASFLPGLAGLLATGLAGALLFAYVLQGLAVIHVYSRGVSLRPLLLAAVYISILLLGWVAIIVAIVGLAEPLINLRHRPGAWPATPPQQRNYVTRIGVSNMQVILLERIGRLGQMGDVVNVKDGFARNFLLPQGKALRATKANRKRFEARQGPARGPRSRAQIRGPGRRDQARREELHHHPPGRRERPALRLGFHARHRRRRHRGRLLHRAPPGDARPSDQDARLARHSRRAARRGAAAYRGQCRALRRRGGTPSARRGRDAGDDRGRGGSPKPQELRRRRCSRRARPAEIAGEEEAEDEAADA